MLLASKSGPGMHCLITLIKLVTMVWRVHNTFSSTKKIGMKSNKIIITNMTHYKRVMDYLVTGKNRGLMAS